MLHPAFSTLRLGQMDSDTEWLSQLGLAMGLVAVTLLLLQLWRRQRQYAVELAEQARQTAEEQEKTRAAREAGEALARESQAKSEMLATLSREIRANLNGIMGSADLMLDHALPATQRAHLTTLRSSAESLHQSLNDVLDYSSIETGQIKINAAAFDLRQPLVEVVDHVSPLASLKGLELVLIVTPDVPLQISGDATRLRQILLNLMSNAVKFTATGRVVLRVEMSAGSTAASKQGATWLHFSVTDTGPGIAEDVLATIFEKFAASDMPSPRAFGGSGLALPICKRLAELMGGHIGARCLPGSGSEFWAVLPFVAEKVSPAPAIGAGDLHVVVLDDLSPSRVAVSAMLTRLGIDHDVTETVAKAAELLRDALAAGARDLVLLLDESVVADSAVELARTHAPDTPLGASRIILLARNPETATPPGHEFPVAAFVRKPVLRPETLLMALRKKSAGAAKPRSSRAPFEAGGESRHAAVAGPRVLVVDDDEISRSVSAQLLLRLGCVVERANGGDDAIERVRTSRFDLIFMDCQMPGTDGFAATKKIRAADGEAPPIVALTANTTAADRERCFAAGMCDFVDKPVRKAELARILKRWTTQEAAATR